MRSNLCIEPQFSQGSWSRPGIAPSDLNNFLFNFTCTKDKMLYKFIVYLSTIRKRVKCLYGVLGFQKCYLLPFFQNIVCRYIYGICETLLADQIRKILLAKTGSPPDLNIQSTIGLGNLTSICRAP